jgi:hypothetical protein
LDVRTRFESESRPFSLSEAVFGRSCEAGSGVGVGMGP